MSTNKFLTQTGVKQPDFTDLSGAASVAQYPTMVGDSGSGGTKGAVPAPAAGDAAAGKFLKADGTFAVPSGSSTVISVNVIGASASITITGITTPVATGLFRVEIYEEVTSGIGNIQTTISYTDDNGAQTTTPISNPLSGVGFADGIAIIRDLATNAISYTITLVGVATYSVFIRLTPLG